MLWNLASAADMALAGNCGNNGFIGVVDDLTDRIELGIEGFLDRVLYPNVGDDLWPSPLTPHKQIELLHCQACHHYDSTLLLLRCRRKSWRSVSSYQCLKI